MNTKSYGNYKTSAVQDYMNNLAGKVIQNSPLGLDYKAFMGGVRGVNNLKKRVLDRLRNDRERNKKVITQ